MNVYDVAQDEKGYLWVATEEGVCKFDGYNFKLMDLNEDSVSDEIISLFIDSNDRVWLNSTGPLRYIENDSVFLIEEVLLSFDWNFKMFEDDFGNLWVATGTSVFWLDAETLELKSIPDNMFDQSFHYKLLANHNSKVYLLTLGGIQVISDKTSIDTIRYPASENANNSDKYRSIINWPNLYYIDYDGLWKLNLKTNEKNQIDDTYRSIKELGYHDGTLTASLESGGFLTCTMDKNGEVIHKRTYFEQLNAARSYFDNHNNLWIPTLTTGLYLYKPKSKYIKNFVRSKEVNSIAINHMYADDNNTSVWLGGFNGMLYEVDGSSIVQKINTNQASKQYNRITGFEKINENDFFVATDEGLFEYRNGQQKSILQVPIKGLDVKKDLIALCTKQYIRAQNLDQFLGSSATQNEASIDDANGIHYFNKTQVYSTFVDSKENIWISDKEHGLYKVDESDTTFYYAISPIFKRQCQEITELQSGEIVVALKGRGIVIIKDDEFSIIDETNGLSSNIVTDIAQYENNVYVSTNNGINIVQIDSEDIYNFSIKLIDKSTGLRTNEISSISVNKKFIFAGTTTGFITINREIENVKDQSESEAPTYISNIIVNGESIPYDTMILLEDDQNDINFKYSSINFDSPNTAYYAYKLEGIDSLWNSTNSIQARYNNLGAGDYVFNVGVSSTPNATPLNPTRIAISIKQRFVDTLAFKFIAFLLFSGLAGVIILSRFQKYQKNVLKSEVRIKTKELQLSVKNLESVNLELKQSNQILKNYAHIASHDLKSPLRHIGAFIQLFRVKNKDKLDGADLSYLDKSMTSVNKMEKTINDLLVFASIHKQTSKEQININQLIAEIKIELQDLIESRNVTINTYALERNIVSNVTGLKQVFQNLIENAIKYNKSNNPTLEITYSNTQSLHKFEVSDNGIGIPSKFRTSIFDIFKRLHSDNDFEGSGIGLAICKRIIDRSGGNISVEPNYPQGSTFIFTIPKIEL